MEMGVTNPRFLEGGGAGGAGGFLLSSAMGGIGHSYPLGGGATTRKTPPLGPQKPSKFSPLRDRQAGPAQGWAGTSFAIAATSSSKSTGLANTAATSAESGTSPVLPDSSTMGRVRPRKRASRASWWPFMAGMA